MNITYELSQVTWDFVTITKQITNNKKYLFQEKQLKESTK
jgi:hypothetical protein